MPHIPGPYPLHLKALRYLTEDRLYPVSQAAHPPAPFRGGIKAPLLAWREHFNPSFAQLLLKFRLPVGPIPEAISCCLFSKRFEHTYVVEIGRSHYQSRYHSRPAHSDVESKAVESLLYRVVFAKRSFTSKPFRAGGASKLTDRDGEAVYDSEARVAVSLLDEPEPKGLLYFPEVGRLANESSAVNTGQGREEVREVTAEVIEDSLILAQREVLADELDSKDFAISQARPRAALSQAVVTEMKVEGVVNETKHVYNEGIEVQGERPPIDDLPLSIESVSPWTFNSI